MGVRDPEARCVLIKSLAFESANLEYKKIPGSSKVKSIPIDEWILHMMNVEIFGYSTEAWVGEAISYGMSIHQNAKCFHWHRKWISEKGL